MKNITDSFEDTFDAYKAVLFYKSKKEHFYMESYDIDSGGKPINAHPLSLEESHSLAHSLNADLGSKQGFLQSRSIIGSQVLFISHETDGYAIWYTENKSVNLYFKSSLTIPDGECNIPPLLWKASKKGLSVWALARNERPTLKTQLYYAPFFNGYENGSVCMGSVDIEIDKNADLESFINAWENYFFNSHFSHLIASDSPVKGNIVQLWTSLSGTKKSFPMKMLKKYPKTLKEIIR